jgi:hypothetical protein
VLLDQRVGDLADVLPGVAVVWRRLVPCGREQRAGEPVDLRTGVVEVVLRGHIGALGAQQPGQRVADGGPAHPADVDRTGRVGRDELQVHPLTGERRSMPVGIALLDDDARGRPGGGGAQPDVQEAGAGDRHALDRRVLAELAGDRPRELTRLDARLPRDLEGERRGVVAVPRMPGPLHAHHIGQHRRIEAQVGQRGHGGSADGISQLRRSHAMMLP